MKLLKLMQLTPFDKLPYIAYSNFTKQECAKSVYIGNIILNNHWQSSKYLTQSLT